MFVQISLYLCELTYLKTKQYKEEDELWKDYPKLDVRKILSSSWTPHGSSLQVVVEYAPSRDDPWGVHRCYAVFVEKAPKVARVIKENLASLGISDKAEVICRDASSFTSAEKFQLIIADPPYDKFQGTKLDNLAEMLDEEGILALSHPGEAPEIAGLRLLKTSAYANARISLYQR